MQLSIESFAACLMSLLLLDVCKRATPQLLEARYHWYLAETDRAETWHDRIFLVPFHGCFLVAEYLPRRSTTANE